MSPRVKTDPSRQNMDRLSQPRHTPLVQGISNLTSRAVQDDELSSQDNFSLCSSTHQGPEMKHWALNDDALDHSAMSVESESPEVQMLSFSLSQQFLPSTASQSDVMYNGLPSGQDQELDFSHAQDFHNYSSFVDFAFDNDACAQNGSHGADDALSVGHSSHTDDSQLVSASDAWSSLTVNTGNYHGSTLDQLSNIYQPVPVSPPLTDDVSVTSSSSHSGYPSFIAHDDALIGDVTTTPIGNQSINLGDPMFPLTPPLSEQDRNRTVRPSKQARRPALSTAASRSQVKQDQEFFPSLPVREPLRQTSKEGADLRNPRDHPYYSLPTHSDGKYYCPFASGEKPCNHPPTTQKCAYHKYLDSHLKPYRCRVPACLDSQLQFSSNACLFRHEREAHGFHGHGDNPHLCLFTGCDRAIPGYGFPRRWNLYDHMRRVHDYASSERPSSPETSPTAAQTNKKKESSGRKRRVTGVTAAPVMKRSRSNQSQSNALKVAQAPAHHGQRLQNAEKNYYDCRTRLIDELNSISPRDSAMHEKVNASLQELITLGLNYRHIEASQAAAQMAA